MNLCERDGEIRQIRGLLAESREGHGRVALISAAAGAGKTALLRELEAELSDDVIALGASCAPPDRDVPYGMLTELLESPALGAQDARRARNLLENRTVLAGSGFSRLIRDMAEQKPVVITVDGLHNADPESVVHLVRVVRRVPSDRVLVVLSERPQPAEAYSALHSELLGRPHVSFIRLRPLSPRGVREMVDADTGARAAAPPAADLHALTGGSPLLVQALLQDLRASGQTAVADVPPGGPAFGHALLGCLHSAGPTTLAVARGIALLDGAATHALLRRLLDLPLEAVARAVAELDAVGLVRGCRLRHPAAVRVILGEMAQGDRTTWHRRAARLLLDSGTAAAAVARQLLHADCVAETWMAQALVDGAGELLDEDDGEQARACALLALRAGVGDLRLQAEAVAALARAELLLSPAAAPRLYPTCPRRSDTAISHHAWPSNSPGFSGGTAGPGRTERLYGHLARLVDGANPGPAMELRACGTMLTTVFPQLAERIPDLRDQSSDLQLASAAFTTATRMKVFMQLRAVQTHGPRADAVRSAEQVLGATRLSHRTVEPLAMAVATLLGCDRPRLRAQVGRPAAGRSHRPGRRPLGRPDGRPALPSRPVRGRSGRRRTLCAAGAAPDAAAGVGRRARHRLRLAAARVHRDATAWRGRRAAQQAGAGDAVREHPGAAVSVRQGLSPSGHAPVPGGTRRLPRLRRADGEVGHEPFHDGAVALRGGTGAAGLGEPDAAGRLAEEQLSALTSGGHFRVRGMALRVLAATRPPEQRPELLVQAVNLLRYNGDRVELAKALADLEDAQRLLDENEPARRPVRPSLHAVIGGRAALPVQLTAVTAPDALSADRRPPRTPPPIC